jgi:hypothetical protein
MPRCLRLNADDDPADDDPLAWLMDDDDEPALEQLDTLPVEDDLAAPPLETPQAEPVASRRMMIRWRG